MASLVEFRPPQFSEDDTWLPPWLQQCGIERLNVDCMNTDFPTFEQRIEELQFLRKCAGSGESSREEGGYNIGQLVLSETVFSPFSFAQSSDNVVQFHLRLFSDDNSETVSLTTDVCQTEPKSNFPMQPLEHSETSLHKKAINLSPFQKSSDRSQTEDLERPIHKNEFSMHEENDKLSECTDDAVELSIAASEALAINEVIMSDSSEKSSSTSAILEASLKVKQARLYVWNMSLSGPSGELSEIDDLSDLDDTTMETAYEDAGIYFNDEFPGNELSVSQVKDTLDSERDENITFKKLNTSTNNYGVSQGKDTLDSERDENIMFKKLNTSATNYGSSTHKLEDNVDKEIQLENDLSAECVGDETQNKVADNLTIDLSTHRDGYHNDCPSPIGVQTNFGSVLEEKVDPPVAENSFHEPNVDSSPTTSCRHAGNDDNLPHKFQERFQSRWLGGWTLNASQNEMKHVSTMNHCIPEPFARETSFFSESASDGNSFVQNHNKGFEITYQLSIPSQNFPNSSKDAILLSQDVVRSSSASLLDPLCSFVPCSISENICSSPTINYDDNVPTRHFNGTIEHTKNNLLLTSSTNNELPQGGEIDIPIASTSESPRVSRKFTSLKSYSKLTNAKFLDKESLHEMTSREIPETNSEEMVKGLVYPPVFHRENGRTNSHSRASTSSIRENTSQAALAETNVRFSFSEYPKWELSKCKRLNAQEVLASKRVGFSEKLAKTSDNRKLQKAQNASDKCHSTRAAKRSSRSRPYLDSRAQQLNKFLKNPLDAEKKLLIFHNMEFMLTGFSSQKEKEIEGLIRKYGGIVLSQVPPANLKGKRSFRFKPQALPVVLCLKKIQSFKFLYGCAVNAFVLKVKWLTDSIAAGFVLPPKKYMVLSRSIGRMHAQVYTAMIHDKSFLVFNNMGFMLHGETKNFPNIAIIIKHGGGQVFKTLQSLVQCLEAGKVSKGVVIADDESCSSRHLKHCALEQNIPMTSVYWIIRSLYAGQLIPLEEKNNPPCTQATELQRCQNSHQLSQEI